MQLNDILEENSIKTISQKTKVSEENLENLFAKNFESLKKVKALGFISILEREYTADLTLLRDAAHEFYADQGEDKSNTLGIPITEEKKGKSKFFMLFVFSLLIYATWYFFTQFDKKYISEMIPFIDESMFESLISDSEVKTDVLEALSIGSVTSKKNDSDTPEKIVAVEEPIIEVDTQVSDVSIPETDTVTESSVEATPSDTLEVIETVEDITPPEMMVKKVVSILPVSRLWFGIIDMKTNQRDHFSISGPYELDVSEKTWLVATSSAPFSLVEFDETKEFNDAKEHYFKIDANGAVVLSKSDYIALGGWPQW